LSQWPSWCPQAACQSHWQPASCLSPETDGPVPDRPTASGGPIRLGLSPAFPARSGKWIALRLDARSAIGVPDTPRHSPHPPIRMPRVTGPSGQRLFSPLSATTLWPGIGFNIPFESLGHPGAEATPQHPNCPVCLGVPASATGRGPIAWAAPPCQSRRRSAQPEVFRGRLGDLCDLCG
jgi:hypothetical protein